MKFKSFFLLVGALMFLFPALGFAAPVITSVKDPVIGADMGPLKVIATYADGSAPYAYWQDGNPDDPGNEDGKAKAFNGTDGLYFKLSNGGDTYDVDWSLTNFHSSAMTSLTILGYYPESEGPDVFTGIVFDILNVETRSWSAIDPSDPSNPLSTPGSEEGKLVINEEYGYELLDRISYLQGGTPQLTDDLYAGIRINFNSGLAPDKAFNFSLDTDAATPVPIPGAYLLLGSGLLCLIGARKRAR